MEAGAALDQARGEDPWGIPVGVSNPCERDENPASDLRAVFVNTSNRAGHVATSMETPLLIGLGILDGGLLFPGIGLLFWILGSRAIRRGKASLSWPTVAG